MARNSNLDNREKQIMTFLKKHPQASNDFLMEQLFLSRSTLRRSLIELESKGLIIRYHGGIILKELNLKEDTSDERMCKNRQEKIAIASVAKNLLDDNMVLFLDSSSTVSYLAPHLAEHHLTIITNNINLAKDLRNVPELDVYLVPGLLNPHSTSTVGNFALDFVSKFRADLCFLSCRAANVDGFFEGDGEQAKVKQAMMAGAKDTYLLCDNSKFNCSGTYITSPYSKLTGLITSASLPQDISNSIQGIVCKHIVAK